MTDIDSLAAALFGSKRAESQEVLTDATTRTYVGIALTDSDGGTVMVDLDGDVTLPDDVDGIAEHSAEGVEVATGPSVSEGDEVVVTLVGGTPLKTPMVTGVAGEGDRQNERIHDIEADYVKASTLEADVADIGFLKADSATIKGLQADAAKVHDLTADQLSAATAYIASLNAKSVTAETLAADVAKVHDLTADGLSAAAAYIAQLSADSVTAQRIAAISGDFDTVRANAAKVANLTAAQLEADHAKVGQLDVSQIAADHATIGTLDTTYATIANLNAANGRITNLESTKANISDLEADYIKADEIEATYMHANMSNSDVAWIENGTIKDGAIVSAMINDVSANKLTAGTINGSVINVTNLNADNITTGTINGQRIGEGSLSLDKLSEDVYTEAEVDTIVDGLNDRIDGAIETHTGTAVPTLNNQPASSWNTTALRDEHVGDVYYVVNSQSQQNGYCYRFTKSGSTYSWQLIKDSDVTAALSRLTTAEGKITTFDSDISKLKTDTGTLTTKTESLETRMSDAESDILDKVDTTTFNEVSDTVDQHSQTISQHTTAISNKADSSTVTAVTNRVSKNEQDISGINTTIGELQETVETKADGSTVSTISNKLNTVSDTVDGHTQTLASVQNTLSTKADSSTVSTLSTKVNNVSDTVDGHTSQLSSITSTQTTMQTTLDKTVKSSIQLWYSKANTTAPSKPTSQVTSASTNGNAWRIVVPAYNSSYPHYYYCWQYEYVDGTYGWSAVVRDIAMGESQSTARTADSNASAAVTTANTANTNASTALSTANTANTNASEAKTAATTASTTASEAKTTAETAASDASTAKTNAASAVTTANSASTTATNAQNTANANIKSNVQLWFTKANSTAPSKPTSVVSTSNANTANAWNLVVPVWNKNYPHYFYCYQQQKGDGNYQWTDVVYDRATSEAQQLANTTSTNLSTLQTDYATFKQTTQNFESTIGTTYATKTELKDATDDITELEGRVSTNETSISNNSTAIALKANSSDVYTKTAVDGKITQEVADRNAAITAKANEITSTVSQTYTTKQEFADLEIGGRNLFASSLTSNGYPADKAIGAQYSINSMSSNHEVYQLVPVEEGASYVFQYWVDNSEHPGWICIQLLDSEGIVVNKPARIFLDTDYLIRTFTIPSGVTTALVSGRHLAAGYEYAKLKFEKGTKPTDWTPAPEDIETRISSAESSITQNAQNIELKVSKDGVISSINQSAETVKIQASKVQIDGTAIFTAISSDVDDAITSKGYQTSSQVNSAITSKGYVTTTQAQSYASTAKSEAISAAATDATTKANAAESNAKSDTTSRLNAMGADNKVVNGAFVNGTDNWSALGSPTTRNRVQVNGKWWMHCVTTATQYQGYSQNHYTSLGVTVEPSTTYTVGITARGAAANTKVCVGFHWFAPSGTSIVSQSWLTFTVGTTAVRQYQTVTVPSGIDHFNVMVGQSVTTAQEFWITDITLVKGAVNQEWSESSVLAGQASNTANAAAPKASSVKRTQRIWYRTNASSAPATPGTTSSNWVTKADDGNDAWTKMHIAINSTHKYIYTCEQYEMANGTVGYTSVLLDNTITVIDGGNIITGSVTANKLNAANINASKTLTVGAMTDAAASSILNSNVVVGGRNLLQKTEQPSSENVYLVRSAITDGVIRTAPTTSDAYADWKVNYLDYAEYNDGEYTVSVDARLSASSNGYTSINSTIYLGYKLASRWGGTFSSNYDRFTSKSISGITNEWKRVSVTFKVPDDLNRGQASALVAGSFLSVEFYCEKKAAAVDWRRPKLEKGNKATDWSPAPEDMATSSSVDQTYVQNLTPYFLTDMTKTSDEYWANLTYERFTRLGDGWAHFEYTNSGSSAVNNYIKPKVLDFLEPGGKYTLLIEFKNVSISKDGGAFYSQQGSDLQVWGDSSYCGFAITNAAIRALSGGAGTFYKTLTLLTADSKDPSGTVRGTLPKTSFMSINQQVSAGQTVSYDLRLSLYEDGYTGPYKPYSGDQLYATNSALAGTNESLEGAIADIGELSDQLVDTTTEQNKTITDIQTYLNSLRQDLDAEIQSRQQWLNFNAAEGLVIGAAGSTFKTVTTNTSQQFRSGGTVLAETSGTEFVAPVMRSDQIFIGSWMWTRRDNGNLSLKWIG